MNITPVIVLLISLLGCAKSSTHTDIGMDTIQTEQSGNQLSYLALGDSYTIGEAVPQDQSFPSQLAAAANLQNLKIGKPTIVATTGWTTNELQTAIKSSSLQPKYDMVTLLIGVNNQYRGYSIDTYRTEFKDLLQTAINYAGGNTAHVFVVSIPDWGATPFGKQSGRNIAEIAKEIDAFNAVNREETLKRSVSYTDITSASRNAATDGTLVAGDGLHPSGKMYQDWAAHILPSVLSVFKK